MASGGGGDSHAQDKDSHAEDADSHTEDLRIASLFGVAGKAALVTGGGSGLGLAMAAALVQNGARVYIAGRRAHALQAAAARLSASGPGVCTALPADLASRAAAESLAADLAAREPALHILINNAGLSWGAPLADFDEPRGWDRLLAVNLKAPFYLTAACAPLLAAAATTTGNSDPARVINISSVAGIQASAEGPLSAPGSGTWSYAASKAALNHLTRVMATSLAKYNIVVNAIAPGVFPSRMTRFGIQAAKDAMLSAQPLGRIGTPQDIAGVVLFLCSPASAHLTGTVIPVDGGSSLVGGTSALSRL